MNRGIRSLENGGMSGGPIWEWIKKQIGVSPEGREKWKEFAGDMRGLAKSQLSEHRPPIQADTLVGKPREDLYNLLALQEEGAPLPEGGQQMLLDVLRGPAADSLATLHEQLTRDTRAPGKLFSLEGTYTSSRAPDIEVEIPEVVEGAASASWGDPSWLYERDLRDTDAVTQILGGPDVVVPRKEVDPDLPVPASIAGYAQFTNSRYGLNPDLDLGRPRIAIDPYHAMHSGYGVRTPEGYVGRDDPDFWDAKKQQMERTLAHEYSHIRRGPREVHGYEAGPEYGDSQEVAAAAWQALRETKDEGFGYGGADVEDAVDRAEKWYTDAYRGPAGGEHEEKIRESLRDEIELFLKQPIYEQHPIRDGRDREILGVPVQGRHYRPSVSQRDKYPWRWR
tara:strand:- start:88 stop:1269 length:1182 start_codon:yes stop_codon:yes gene_type:complete